MTMDRRIFLKGMAVGLGVFAFPSFQTGSLLNASSGFVEASVLGRLFRGTRDGQILESLDHGRTWNPIANFGNHCSIRAILERETEIYTEVGLQGYSFYLRSPDARTWYTVDRG
jgi:hypothetical protein